MRALLDRLDAIGCMPDRAESTQACTEFLADFPNRFKALLLTADGARRENAPRIGHYGARRLVSLMRRFRYRHRLVHRRRRYTDAQCGAYPFRDTEREVVRVLSVRDESEPALSGSRYAYAQVEPFICPGLRKRARAALYESRLEARTLTAHDLQGAHEQALIGQWGVFAKRPIPAGTCLGVYGGLMLKAADVFVLGDERYLINGRGLDFLDGENMLSLANTLLVVDDAGRVLGHPETAYNMEAAKFPAQLAHGWALPITALFATSDIAAGNELRWNYRQFGVKPLIR